MTGSHGKVGQGSEDDNHGGDDVVETLGDRNSPGHAGEDDGSNDHDNKDNPKSPLTSFVSNLVFRQAGDDSGDGRDGARRLHGGHCLNGVDNHDGRSSKQIPNVFDAAY